MHGIELMERLSVALAIGLVIGLERGWQQRTDADGDRTAGVRTHALAALLGGVWGATTHLVGPGAGGVGLGLAFMAFSAVIAVYRYRETNRSESFGATTVVAAMLAFALGAFAVLGDMRVAAATGVATAGVLALKGIVHGIVARLTWPELRSSLVLLAMTFILLPFLPNRTVDPFAAINPYEIWLLTILIAAISFVGYVAVKVAGQRQGILMTGLAGGLVSSTAVTVTLAKLASLHREQQRLLMAGALIASATMFARVLVVVAAVNVQLLPYVVLPLGLAGLTLFAIGLFEFRREPASAKAEQLQIENPFDLVTVLKFGALLTIVMLLAKVLTTTIGPLGAYALAAVSGIADVDAIALTMARHGADQLGPQAAALSIILAAAVNTVSKAALAWFSGGAKAGRRMALAAGAALAAGICGLLLWFVYWG